MTAPVSRLARELAARASSAATAERRFDASSTSPLSEGAGRLWRAHLVGAGAEYSVPFALDVTEPVDADRLVAAVGEVIEANPVLRSTIVESRGEFHYAPSDGVVPEAEAVTRAELGPRTEEIVAAPFGRTAPGPLTRIAVLRAPGGLTRIVVVFHHVVIDGESVTLLLDDVFAAYTTSGAAAARLRPQYPDLDPGTPGADATRRAGRFWDARAQEGAGLDVWNARGPAATVDAVVDRAPVAGAEGVADTARRIGVGSGSVWCAATALALGRVLGADALTVRIPAVNRRELEEFDTIGPFVTTVPLTFAIDDTRTLSEFVRMVDHTLTGAMEHARLAPSGAGQDGADILLNIQTTGSTRDALRGAGLDVVPVHSGHAKSALTVSLQWGPDAADGQVESALEGWDADTHDGLRHTLERMLHALATRPDARPGEVDVGEYGRVGRDAVEQSGEPGGQWTHLLEALADRAAEAPEAVAVIDDDRILNRAGLMAGVAERAQRLRAAGVTRGDTVLVPGARSGEFVMWAAAIMDVGAAYVPVDPVGGASRIPHIVSSSGARFGIPLGGWRPDTDLAMVDDTASTPVLIGSADRVPRASDGVAYVIYTSGTTGAPKGVAVPHSAISALISSTGEHLGNGDIASCLHSMTFDFSVWELWCALAVGAGVRIYRDETVCDPFELLGALEADSVSVLSLTNTALGALVSALESDPSSSAVAPRSVRRVVLGGEPVSADFVARWSARAAGGCVVVNMLGATETTVHTTGWTMACTGPGGLGGVPVGRALDHLDVVVVDAAGRSLPRGVGGEIAVRGHGVAYGYLGRPRATAGAFVPDPFAGALTGGRMYLTGDRGRWSAVDGVVSLFCHGRSDGQLKVRGHRIEAIGVEAVVDHCPGVLRSCVIAHEGSLVAFVQLAAAGEAESGRAARRIREAAAAGLAHYEVPDVIHEVRELPVTVNGKLDRSPEALFALATGEPGPGPRGRGALDERIVAAVREVLAVDEIDWSDGFTANGGDSIKAVQLAGAMRRAGYDVGVREILQAPGLGELAAPGAVPGSMTGDDDESTPPFALVPDEVRAQLPADAMDAYPLSAGQEGMLFRVLFDGAVGVYHNTVSIRIRGDIDPRAFRVALIDTMRRHDVLRTAVDREVGFEPLQVVYRCVDPRFEYIDATDGGTDSDALLTELVDRERRTPFALDVAPLFRMVLVRVGDGENQLIVSDNHVILDGWSWTSTLAELFSRHNALVRRDGGYVEGTDDPARTRFADFIAAERAVRDDDAATLAWREHLADVPVHAVSDLRSRGPRDVHRIRVDVSRELHEGLLDSARAVGVSPRHLMMAVHFRCLADEFETRDLLTGITANGRLERTSGDDVRGMFLNMLPLRMRVDDDLGTLARRCAETEADMSPWRRLPLVDIQQAAGRGPLFDYGFNFVQFHRLGRIEDSHEFGSLDDPHYSREDTEFALMATFSVHPPEHRLGLFLVVDADRVSATRADRLTNRYRSTLAAAAELRKDT